MWQSLFLFFCLSVVLFVPFPHCHSETYLQKIIKKFQAKLSLVWLEKASFKLTKIKGWSAFSSKRLFIKAAIHWIPIEVPFHRTYIKGTVRQIFKATPLTYSMNRRPVSFHQMPIGVAFHRTYTSGILHWIYHKTCEIDPWHSMNDTP
jgi:hypothetical protein